MTTVDHRFAGPRSAEKNPTLASSLLRWHREWAVIDLQSPSRRMNDFGPRTWLASSVDDFLSKTKRCMLNPCWISDRSIHNLETQKKMSHSFINLAKVFLVGMVFSLVVAGCSVTGQSFQYAEISQSQSAAAGQYAAIRSEKFPVDAIEMSEIDPQFWKQVVSYSTSHPPGTVVVDPHNRFLYLVEKGGKAVRYGVGVGKAGLAFAGTASVQEKKEWPHWTPTSNMIAREPRRYGKWAAGMDGGPGNPLGARALYLYKDGQDTRYRIHGTTEPQSIGKAVSSGCIRMLNQDVMDLYMRVPIGSKVVVL